MLIREINRIRVLTNFIQTSSHVILTQISLRNAYHKTTIERRLKRNETARAWTFPTFAVSLYTVLLKNTHLLAQSVIRSRVEITCLILFQSFTGRKGGKVLVGRKNIQITLKLERKNYFLER